MPTCPDTWHLHESDLSTGLVYFCGTVVVQLHHAAVVEPKGIGIVAHFPADALCCLLKCAFQHWRGVVTHSGCWGFNGNHSCAKNGNTHSIRLKTNFASTHIMPSKENLIKYKATPLLLTYSDDGNRSVERVF